MMTHQPNLRPVRHSAAPSIAEVSALYFQQVSRDTKVLFHCYARTLYSHVLNFVFYWNFGELGLMKRATQIARHHRHAAWALNPFQATNKWPLNRWSMTSLTRIYTNMSARSPKLNCVCGTWFAVHIRWVV